MLENAVASKFEASIVCFFCCRARSCFLPKTQVTGGEWPKAAVKTLEIPVLWIEGRGEVCLVDMGFCNCDCMLGRFREAGVQVQERYHGAMHRKTDSVIAHYQYEGLRILLKLRRESRH